MKQKLRIIGLTTSLVLLLTFIVLIEMHLNVPLLIISTSTFLLAMFGSLAFARLSLGKEQFNSKMSEKVNPLLALFIYSLGYASILVPTFINLSNKNFL